MINEKRYESKSPIKFELRYEVPACESNICGVTLSKDGKTITKKFGSIDYNKHPKLELSNIYSQYIGNSIHDFCIFDRYGYKYETLIKWIKSKLDSTKTYNGIYVDDYESTKKIIFTAPDKNNDYMISIVNELVFNSDNDIILFDIDTKEFIICPYNLKSFMIREYIEEAKTND